MKKTFIIISILFLNSCITRPVVLTFKDSVIGKPLASRVVTDWSSFTDTGSWQPATLQTAFPNLPMYKPSKQDTIPTILIYIDTSWVVLSEFELAEAGLSDIYSKSIKYEIKDYNIKWMNGYEIREKSAVGGGGTAVPLPVDWVHYTTIEYLNENKQPLSKNIIVLMTK